MLFGSFWICQLSVAQEKVPSAHFTHADTLRGSIGPYRAWWDVLYYDIQVRPDFVRKFISGSNAIRFRVLRPGKRMQIDLQAPLKILSVQWQNQSLPVDRDGNAWFAEFPRDLPEGSTQTIEVRYEGLPRVAIRPPWDGGWIFTHDKLGRPWMSVACQGLGASVWYPCKDHQSDEPDEGASLHITVPDTLVAVGNGRLKEKKPNNDGTTTWVWSVVSPINNYDIVPYIGKYVTWHEDYAGEKGKLDCDFWVLDYDEAKARVQFKQVDTMLHCFEYWMGPYPFYDDSYKLVDAPHLGMEHQSAVAYGNRFMEGYLGHDLSGTGWGLKWDYIIVHESGHEWFGNNITTKDIADMWVHEGITDYSETLFVTCLFGIQAGNEYCIGLRRGIANEQPIIGHYGVNQEGSEDMYNKGSQLIHIIRQLIGDDQKFREIWRGLNRDFYHQTVTSKQVEDYISSHAGKDFSKIFDQYLRTTQIPLLEYKTGEHSLSFRWTHCVRGFTMPVKVNAGMEMWLQPTEDWTTTDPGAGYTPQQFSVDKNFYVYSKKVD